MVKNGMGFYFSCSTPSSTVSHTHVWPGGACGYQGTEPPFWGFALEPSTACRVKPGSWPPPEPLLHLGVCIKQALAKRRSGGRCWRKTRHRHLAAGLGLWVRPSWASLPARREITPVPHTGDVSSFSVSPGDTRVSCSCSFLRSLLSARPIRFRWGRVGDVGLVLLGSGSGWLWTSRPSCRRADGPRTPGTRSRGTFRGCQPLGAGRAQDAPGRGEDEDEQSGLALQEENLHLGAAVSPSQRRCPPHSGSVPHAVVVSPMQCHFPTRSHGDPRPPFHRVHASCRCHCHSI